MSVFIADPFSVHGIKIKRFIKNGGYEDEKNSDADCCRIAVGHSDGRVRDDRIK